MPRVRCPDCRRRFPSKKLLPGHECVREGAQPMGKRGARRTGGANAGDRRPAGEEAAAEDIEAAFDDAGDDDPYYFPALPRSQHLFGTKRRAPAEEFPGSSRRLPLGTLVKEAKRVLAQSPVALDKEPAGVLLQLQLRLLRGLDSASASPEQIAHAVEQAGGVNPPLQGLRVEGVLGMLAAPLPPMQWTQLWRQSQAFPDDLGGPSDIVRVVPRELLAPRLGIVGAANELFRKAKAHLRLFRADASVLPTLSLECAMLVTGIKPGGPPPDPLRLSPRYDIMLVTFPTTALSRLRIGDDVEIEIPASMQLHGVFLPAGSESTVQFMMRYQLFLVWRVERFADASVELPRAGSAVAELRAAAALWLNHQAWLPEKMVFALDKQYSSFDEVAERGSRRDQDTFQRLFGLECFDVLMVRVRRIDLCVADSNRTTTGVVPPYHELVVVDRKIERVSWISEAGKVVMSNVVDFALEGIDHRLDLHGFREEPDDISESESWRGRGQVTFVATFRATLGVVAPRFTLLRNPRLHHGP